MPNWPLSGQVRTYIRNRAIELSARALEYAQTDFPLTTAQVQFSVLPEDKVHTLRKYIEEGVRTIEQHRQVRLAFLRENFPELRRGAVVALVLPEWIVVGRGTAYGIATTKFSMSEQHYLVPEFTEDRPGEPTRAELVAWINRAIRQRRLHEITTHTVGNILDNYAPTCAHLHEIWPMLATLINSDDSTPTYYVDRKFYETWRTRLRAPTRALKTYKPDPEVLNKYKKLIHAADTAITAGLVLPPYVHQRKTIAATLENWEPIEGDTTF